MRKLIPTSPNINKQTHNSNSDVTVPRGHVVWFETACWPKGSLFRNRHQFRRHLSDGRFLDRIPCLLGRNVRETTRTQNSTHVEALRYPPGSQSLVDVEDQHLRLQPPDPRHFKSPPIKPASFPTSPQYDSSAPPTSPASPSASHPQPQSPSHLLPPRAPSSPHPHLPSPSPPNSS